MTDEHYDRSKYEAILDLRYSIRLHERTRRFYLRLRVSVAIFILATGGAAVSHWIDNNPKAVALCGAIVFTLTILDVVLGWAERAAKHEMWRRELCGLLERAPRMSLEEVDAELARHDAAVDDEIESLRVVAYNDNLRSNGREDYLRPESFSDRIARAFS